MEGMWHLCPIITRARIHRDAETKRWCHLGTKWEVYFWGIHSCTSFCKSTVYGEKVEPYIIDDINVLFPLINPKKYSSRQKLDRLEFQVFISQEIRSTSAQNFDCSFLKCTHELQKNSTSHILLDISVYFINRGMSIHSWLLPIPTYKQIPSWETWSLYYILLNVKKSRNKHHHQEIFK